MAVNILFIFSITVKENLSNRVDKLEDRLSQVPLFRKEFNKELREILKGHLDDIKKKVINIQQIFLQHLMLEKKSNVMHDLFLIYVTLNCRLYRIFIVLIFQKIVFYFFFLMSVNRLIRWEMSWLSLLEEILNLFRCWLEPMTWDIKQRYNYDFFKFYFLWYCEMLRKSMFKFHGKKTIRKWI